VAVAEPGLREGLREPPVDKARRKALAEQFAQAPPEAGVYRIVNRRTGRALLGSTTNLGGLRNRFEFARSTGSGAALDHRLREDFAGLGVDAFSFEVLDTLEVTPAMTLEQVASDLATLEGLWRQKTDPSLLY
jgi:hypothetical protein